MWTNYGGSDEVSCPPLLSQSILLFRGGVSAGAFAPAVFWKLFTWNQENGGFTLVDIQFTRSLHPWSENPNSAPVVAVKQGRDLSKLRLRRVKAKFLLKRRKVFVIKRDSTQQVKCYEQSVQNYSLVSFNWRLFKIVSNFWYDREWWDRLISNSKKFNYQR